MNRRAFLNLAIGGAIAAAIPAPADDRILLLVLPNRPIERLWSRILDPGTGMEVRMRVEGRDYVIYAPPHLPIMRFESDGEKIRVYASNTLAGLFEGSR